MGDNNRSQLVCRSLFKIPHKNLGNQRQLCCMLWFFCTFDDTNGNSILICSSFVPLHQLSRLGGDLLVTAGYAHIPPTVVYFFPFLVPLTAFHTSENCKRYIQPSENSRSVLADKLTPIIFKSSSGGGGGGSRSSLFGIMLSALNIVYSICTGADRRLLWSVLFFKQSISDIALFSWDRVIFSHWPGDITQPLMESWRLDPPPPTHPPSMIWINAFN